VEDENGQFIVLRSPWTAEHEPDYEEVARYPTAELAAKRLARVKDLVDL
jgi:hypothetical protein